MIAAEAGSNGSNRRAALKKVRKMSEQHKFEFSIDGEGVSPSTVGLRALVEILQAFEATVAITAAHSGMQDSSDSQLHLIGVREGSDTLTLMAGDKMYAASKTVTRALAENSFDDIPLAAYESIRQLSRRAKSTGWSFRISSPRTISGFENGMVEAVIKPDEDILLPSEISGGTTLLAKLDRVGGESYPTATIFLQSGEKMTVELKDSKMAEELKEFLFKPVSLEGNAIWDFDTWKIKSFKVESIGEYHDTDAREAFKILSETAGNRWEGVNPEDFVAELRNE